MTSLPELGVVGWPLETTFSPPMQRAALQHVGLQWRYDAIPIPPEGFPTFFRRAAGVMRGFNVTMPHKPAAQRLCSVLDGLAASSGAVNTVVFSKSATGQVAEGYNTDGPGLLKALEHRCGFTARGSSVLILGSGGAAAGCTAALARAGAHRLTVASRTAAHADELISKMQPMFEEAQWAALPLGQSDALIPRVAEADLVVNCIPEEGAAAIASWVAQPAQTPKVFCDLSYSAHPGALFASCQAAGFAVVPGLEVLLWQGVFAFELFTECQAPVEAMRQALTQIAGEWWLRC